MDKILIIPSGKAGDKIIQAYKDAGYKIKKPKHLKHNKVEIKAGTEILEHIKYIIHYDSTKAR